MQINREIDLEYQNCKVLKCPIADSPTTHNYYLVDHNTSCQTILKIQMRSLGNNEYLITRSWAKFKDINKFEEVCLTAYDIINIYSRILEVFHEK